MLLLEKHTTLCYVWQYLALSSSRHMYYAWPTIRQSTPSTLHELLPAATVVAIVVAIVRTVVAAISSVVATALLAAISSTATLLTTAVARAPIIVASIVATATLLTAAVARRGTPSLVTPFVVIVTGVGPAPAVASAAPAVVVSVVMHPPLAAFLAQFLHLRHHKRKQPICIVEC
mmetsp:Transcript_32143/g.42810  ORF Transcript_32143/g.42810 Transcript_32143/m.42810 type:complete len:175 (-) Transcript_32143:387-911(-)